MRLIKMIGGLGNQMFIYAFYLQMRKRFSDTRIDLSDIRHYRAHNGYELERVFGIKDNEFCLPKPVKKILELLFFKVVWEGKHNLETTTAYTKPYTYPWVYFKGFYQSEKYFKEVEEEVRKAFTFDCSRANSESKRLAEQIKADAHAVALHVRRGDYHSPKFYKLYGSVCTLEYYKAAVERILEVEPEAHFYLFSDDPNWVREHINLPNATVVDCNHGKDSWQDMMLMSFCKHNIICNSTFSWWGAWLNSNPSKFVIAPAQWLAGHEYPNLIPQTWTRV